MVFEGKEDSSKLLRFSMAVLSLFNPVRSGDEVGVSLDLNEEEVAVVDDRIEAATTAGFTFVSSSVSDSSSLDSSSLDDSVSSFLAGMVAAGCCDWRNRD